MEGCSPFHWVKFSKQQFVKSSFTELSQNIHISNSRFFSITKGSAIIVINQEIYIILKDSSFDECSGAEVGSGMNISLVGKGSISMSRVCGTRCSASEDTMFTYVKTDNNITGSIDVFLLSLSQCNNQNAIHEMYFIGSSQEIKNSNFSNNNIDRYVFPTCVTGLLLRASFCNVAKNTLKNERTQQLASDSVLESINYVYNQRENSVSYSLKGVVQAIGSVSVTVRGCVLNNNINCENCILVENYAKVTIIECKISGNLQTTNNGEIEKRSTTDLEEIKMTLFGSCQIGAAFPFVSIRCLTHFNRRFGGLAISSFLLNICFRDSLIFNRIPLKNDILS